MTHPDSWMRVKQVAEQRRDASARSLARLVKRIGEAQQQLDQLLEYRSDYRARFDSTLRKGMRGEWLHDYQTFLANLEQAIALQSDVVAGLQRQVADAKAKVAVEQRRTESYQIIDDRRQEASATLERRQQQKLQDEMGPRLATKLVAGGKH